MSDILEKLNKVQKEATVYTGGPLLILAGAGSGKTRVLTYKIAYLLEIQFCAPWEILAITFTNKAAKEMKERVEDLVGEISKEIWLGTFHSVCVRILKREIGHLGYTRDFNIIDEQDKLKIIKEIMKKQNIDDKSYPASTFIYAISSAKDKLNSYSDYLKEATGDYRKEKIAMVYEEYQKTMKKNNALDFDDIIFKTVELFKKEEDVLKHYQNKFKYVLVDEYQDTNHAQFMLVSMLVKEHGHICVVGDESQSIYGFRGADISNILEFEKTYKNARIIKLEQNYRSTKTILNAANNVIKNNTSKIDKALWTENNEGEKIKYFTARNEYEEIGYIVNMIDTHVRQSIGKLSYKDFAILYRTNAQSRVIEEMFLREGIPYKLIGGTKFYSRKEIKDITSYLKLINNPKDNVSLSRIINEPKRGIGDTSVEKLKDLAEKENLSIFEYIKTSTELSNIRCTNALIQFKDIIENLISLKSELNISELIKKTLVLTGYEAELKKEKTTENESRIENIYEFIGVASEFENQMIENTLTDFLDSIALIADVDSLEETNETVTLMTMHNAKGLEYQVIFLCGMEEGLFPSKRSLDETSGVEEERRLCYVGITRAKEKLFLTNAAQRTMYGTTTYTMPSRFVEEIPEDFLDDAGKENKEEKAYRKSVYTDSEFSASQRKLSSTFITSNKTSVDPNHNLPKFGTSAVDFLRNINREKITDNTVSKEDLIWLKEGIRVSHKKFGEGLVTKLESEDGDIKVEIMFDKYGMKRLMAAHAGLEEIL